MLRSLHRTLTLAASSCDVHDAAGDRPCWREVLSACMQPSVHLLLLDSFVTITLGGCCHMFAVVIQLGTPLVLHRCTITM